MTWTESSVEEWLREAAQTLRLLPDTEVQAGLRSGHPEVYQTAGDLFAAEVERRKSGLEVDKPRVRLTPAPGAIDRLGQVMGWFAPLADPQGVRVLWARANGFSWRKVGKRVGRGKDWVIARHGLILRTLTTNLNGVDK